MYSTDILRQRTEDVDVKRYFIHYLETAGSFEYTKKVLLGLEEQYVYATL
jgi:geranylgeranyl diphosphate synthase type 3